MYALITFAGQNFHSIETGDDLAGLQSLVSQREGADVKWVEVRSGLEARSVKTPLWSYRLQTAS